MNIVAYSVMAVIWKKLQKPIMYLNENQYTNFVTYTPY